MDKKTGCLIIHGFSGGVYEVEPLAGYLAKEGFETVCPELKGHTGRRRDIAFVSYKDWIASAEEELVKLKSECEKIAMIGFSMGGLIAVNLALKHKPDVLVTLSMPIFHWDFSIIARNILEDFKAREASNLRRYVKSSTIPVTALLNFKALLQRTKGRLKDISTPIFIAQGLKDDTVQARSAEYIYRYTGSEIKELKYYNDSEHLICHGPDSENLFRDVAAFIRK